MADRGNAHRPDRSGGSGVGHEVEQAQQCHGKCECDGGRCEWPVYGFRLRAMDKRDDHLDGLQGPDGGYNFGHERLLKSIEVMFQSTRAN